MTVPAARSSVDAVVFDWGGVLTVSPDAVATRLLRNAGIDLSELRRRRSLFEAGGSEPPHAPLERGELPLEDYLRALDANLPGSDVLWNEASPHFMFDRLTVRPQMLDAVRALRERGFRTALLTNNVAEMWPRLLATTPVDELFDVVVNSAFVGMRKPEARIYEHTLEQLGVEAHRSVFLDDMVPNIAAARAVGMRTVTVRSPGPAMRRLEHLLASD